METPGGGLEILVGQRDDPTTPKEFVGWPSYPAYQDRGMFGVIGKQVPPQVIEVLGGEAQLSGHLQTS